MPSVVVGVFRVNTDNIEYTGRLKVISYIIVLVILVLIGRMGYLQIYDGEYYANLADGNRIRIVPAVAPRGTFYDRNGTVMVTNRPGFAVSLLPLTEPISNDVINRLSILLKVPKEEINSKIEAHTGFDPIRIKTGIGPEIFSIIAEQKDLFSDYNQTQQTEKNFGFFINSEAVEEMVEETTYVTDGYAFYIDSFNDYEEDPYAITMYDQNKGIIKYTSKGLYGFDIAISQSITDVIENVKLQDFENIKKSFDTAIKEQLELSKLNNPTNIQLRSISLDYDMYFPNGELTNITYYPAWNFVLGNTTDTDYTAHVTINAMDGSLVEIMYYDYGE